MYLMELLLRDGSNMDAAIEARWDHGEGGIGYVAEEQV